MGRVFQIAVLAAIVSGSLFTNIKQAVAGHDSDLYCAADRYRDAVVEFERLIRKTHYVQSCDERLADDLEDSTSRLRSAARDPRRIDRLERYAAETDAYHQRVELVFFGIGKYPANPRWEACWLIVSRAHQRLYHQLQCVCSGSGRFAGPDRFGRGSSCSTSRSFDPYRHSSQRSFYRNAIPQSYGFQPQLGVPTGPFATAPAPTRQGRIASPTISTPRTPPLPLIINPPGNHPAQLRGLERSGRELSGRDVEYSRRTISTPEQLRSAVIGALLQRR